MEFSHSPMVFLLFRMGPSGSEPRRTMLRTSQELLPDAMQSVRWARFASRPQHYLEAHFTDFTPEARGSAEETQITPLESTQNRAPIDPEPIHNQIRIEPESTQVLWDAVRGTPRTRTQTSF